MNLCVCVKLLYVKFVCVCVKLLYVSVCAGGGGRRRHPDTESKTRTPHKDVGKNPKPKPQGVI